MTATTICLLTAAAFTGLAWTLLRALHAGARAYSSAYAASTARQFEDLFLFIPPRRVAEAGWASGGLAFLAFFLFGGGLASTRGLATGTAMGAVAAAFALQTPRRLLAVLKQRRLARFNDQLVDTLVSMSNALKAGYSITQAFESVVRDGEDPIAREFNVFLQQTRVGVGFSEGLANLEQRVGSEDLHLVIMAIETARQTGGNLTEIFEKIADTIRARMRIQHRIRTITAQGRLQGIIVGAMPAIIAAALMIVDPAMMLPFLQSNAGILVMVAIAVLITCGALAIRRIVRIDV